MCMGQLGMISVFKSYSQPAHAYSMMVLLKLDQIYKAEVLTLILQAIGCMVEVK